MTTANESYEEWIQQAVARETARRKRVFMTFMALLLVPIAIGGYALAVSVYRMSGCATGWGARSMSTSISMAEMERSLAVRRMLMMMAWA